ncbi:hypothetical protein JQN72_03170 [Phycicoccus sp. CSK15P-2]|uniref:hypothetical protein n=1 Tax=Phycicoccus sp. CSK15P-2 TaxID=2807627 RepID=UPI001951CD6F|nr:hypothetical protein [Phycicoccus sp. CSK15P-2]MBM6403247.1 hypothetical protein [Phycicoccus sp. CSK15P-2]
MSDERDDRDERDGQAPAEDTFGDPTAPPPLPDRPSYGSAPTQPVSTDETQATPTYPEPPGYVGPSYSTPTYESPTYGSPYGAPPPAAPQGTPPAPGGYGTAPAPGAQGPYGSHPGAGTPYPSSGTTPHGGQPPYGGGPVQPVGSPAAGYPPPALQGTPVQPGGSPYAAPPVGYAPTQTNGSALALTIVSGALIFFCVGLLQIPALVFGIVALTKQSSDPEGSRRTTRHGWIAFTIGLVVNVLVLVTFVVFVIVADGGGSSSFETYDQGY